MAPIKEKTSMSNNNSANRERVETKDQDGTSNVLPLGPLMKASMIEWYEYHVRLSEPDPDGRSEPDPVCPSETVHVGSSETDHVRPSVTVKASIAVMLADIMAENRYAKIYREAGVSAFGYISVPYLPDLVHWVRIGDEQRIRIRPGDFGPENCFVPLCAAMLAEFFRDIRETKPELESIHSPPLFPWMEICQKRRAECTGRLPDKAEDSIH